MRDVVRLRPAFKDYLWGGTTLREWYGVQDLDRVAEAWVLSAHPDGMSVSEDGVPFEEIWRAADCGAAFARFPQLIKLIDAKQDLSIQVHPSDAYALEHEGQLGKTEMWYILAAEEGAGIYYGFKEPVTREAFAASIRDNTLTELLQFVPVKPGECYFIPAGTVHAIGKGLLLAEIQQNSNVTYRVYDYDRRDKHGNARELHVEKAVEVADLHPVCLPPAASPVAEAGCTRTPLAACDYFRVEQMRVNGTVSLSTADSFAVLLVLSGNGTVNGQPCGQYDTFFIPANVDAVLSGECEVLVSRM